jgi:pimeloyl-ACP methyl ester carboxylesterase
LEQKNYLYNNSPISYYRYGSGKEIMVAFHGYDQTGSAYAPVGQLLKDRYTLIAIDFFWHGFSEWREPRDFTEMDLRDIVLGIAAQEELVLKKLTVCSFSMGTRMLRAIVCAFPEKIERLILLSPPTIEFNQLVNFTTGTILGLLVFRHVANNYAVLSNWLQRLYRWKILNRSTYLFSLKNIGEKQRMTKVYKTWIAQRKLRTNLANVAKLANKHKIKVILIVGKNDALAPPYKMIKYVRNRFENSKVFLLNKKHELVTQETLDALKKILVEQVKFE